MFRAFLWKELREQAPILIALLVLGSGVIAVATSLSSSAGTDGTIGDFRSYTNAGRAAVLALAVAAGVVIGGSLFAGERENDTFTNLELLPARRMQIWWGKFSAGLFLMSVAGCVLLGMGLALGALGSTSPVGWALWGFVLVFIAFGWGTFGSTFCPTTLSACAVGLVCSVFLGMPIFGIAIAAMKAIISMLDLDEVRYAEPAVWLAIYAVGLVPLIFASAIFTQPDRARKPIVDDPTAPRAMVRRVSRSGGFFSGHLALFWLNRNQWLIPGLVGTGLAIIAGLVCLHEEIQLIIFWPILSCIAGVMAGVLGWSGEQHKDTYRYWGERRLPLSLFWLMKLGSSFLLAIFWAVLIFTPSFILQEFFLHQRQIPSVHATFGSALLYQEEGRILNFVFLWVIYGFAFGHLSGLLFKKTIVAIGVGLLTGGPVAALWYPSIITGGLHAWQLWIVPALAILAARLILRAWTSDRLGTFRPLATLAFLGLLCLGVMAAGFFYRFHEVPVVPEIDDDLDFAKTVPQLDFEDGGRAFRGSMAQWNSFIADYAQHPQVKFLAGSYLSQLAENEWPAQDLADVRNWLNRRSADELLKSLKEAAQLPAGPIENPRGMLVTNNAKEGEQLRAVALFLMARGLWKQSQGDSQEFVDCLDAALAMSRNGRTQQPTLQTLIAKTAEIHTLRGLNTYLERFRGTPDQLRDIIRVLEKHDRNMPTGQDVFLTERMITRNTLNEISQWAPKVFAETSSQMRRNRARDVLEKQGQVEAEILSFALVVPWEKERSRRLFGLDNGSGTVPRAPNGRSVFATNFWLDFYLNMNLFTGSRVTAHISHSQASTRVSMTQAALMLYQLETGKPAEKLEDLVPKYLAAIPVDPFTPKNLPLQYRISSGEQIQYDRKQPEMMFREPERNPLSDEERELHGSFLGGFAFADRPFPVAPGFEIDGTPNVHLDGVAAVAGTLVQWPLESIEVDVGGFGGMPGGPGGFAPGEGPVGVGRRAAGTGNHRQEEIITYKELSAGQGIVWSIGPDGFDDQGKKRAPHGNGIGDIIGVVPTLRK